MVHIKDEKIKILNKLNLLGERVKEVNSSFGLDLSLIEEKISKTIENIELERFSIAFFGAFSDGKSTILSVLIDNLSIEISPEPKTDQVTTYDYDDYLIIDTPGLFSENAFHDEKTRNYISEANVIIYTVDPVNPLKDSHHPTLKWLLSEIEKLDSTIFVVNKMDEVADIEDENDFLRNADIKTKVVLDEVYKIIGKNPNHIVCVAADPYQEGYKYWKEDMNKYNTISRIPILREKLDMFILDYKETLTTKTGLSVIKESLALLDKDLTALETSIKNESELLSNQCEETKSKLKNLHIDVHRSHENIKKDIQNLRENIILEFKSVQTSADLSDVVNLKIGRDAFLLEDKINSIIMTHTIELRDEITTIYKSLDETFSYYSNLNEKLLSQMSNGARTVLKGLLSGPTRNIANSILKIRNTLNIPFKFKPWGAVKLAKFMKGIPLLAEILDLAFGAITNYRLEKKISEINLSVMSAFDTLLIEELTFENYCKTYFPELESLNENLIQLEENVKHLNQVHADIFSIKNTIKNDNF